ncbi:RING-H2 finger protein ATL13-like [Rutidosis leptorrhynchoides]|uniref:RING-H2 finger protein ATL13-like n=1 Tax=Rutidosis leptorrhynchoides TaxID=125765 RepID=UPI003A9A3F92
MDRKILLSPYENTYFFNQPPPPPPPPPPFQATTSHLNSNVSPSVLLIIIILAIIFFIAGLLHLLVRFLVKPSNRDPDEFDNVTALQGQLQQLFTLHDSGVDQSFIDSLPVFTYKSIIGAKNPFDCAVCLCEFESDDNLRLLPKCSHAFHMSCIDTWLLSHSTCPLCRSNLLLDYSPNTCCSPFVLVLESGESSRDIVNEPIMQRANSHISIDEELEFSNPNSGQNEVKEDENKEKVVTVKLGKFKNLDVGGNVCENFDEKNKIDGRRCFSMGSFEYVMDDNSSLQVPIRAQIKKQYYKKSNLPIMPGHRAAMSECGDDSRRSFRGIEALTNVGWSMRRESFSVSKICLRGKKEKPNSTVAAAVEPPSTTGMFSLQFLLRQNVNADESKVYEVGCDDQEIQSCQNVDAQVALAPNQQSFAKRILLWLMGRQKNKVVHSNLSTNV